MRKIEYRISIFLKYRYLSKISIYRISLLENQSSLINTYPFLDKFERFFVFSYTQHFHASSFIWCIACDFPDQVTYKFNSFVANLQDIKFNLTHFSNHGLHIILLHTPFLRDGFGFIAFFVTLCPFFRPTAISNGGDDIVLYV